MWFVSFFCLCLTVLACVVAVLSPKYDDNLFQKVGMAFLSLGCAEKAEMVWQTHEVHGLLVLAHLGLVLIAIGSAVKWYARQPGNARRFTARNMNDRIRKLIGVPRVEGGPQKSL